MSRSLKSQQSSIFKSVRDWAIEKVETTRAELYLEVNEEHGTMYEANIPLLLGIVLAEAKSVEDIIPKALEHRHTGIAQAFREWSQQIDNSLRDSRQAHKVIKARSEVKELSKFLATQYENLPWIQIGVAWPLQVSADIRIANPSKRYLLFLHRLFQKSIQIDTIEEHTQ